MSDVSEIYAEAERVIAAHAIAPDQPGLPQATRKALVKSIAALRAAADEIERLRETLEAERQRADKAEGERDARHGGEKWYAEHLHIANAQLASVSRDRDELRLEIEKKRAALKQIAFGPPHEGEVKTVLNQLVEIAQNELKETSQ